MLTTPSPAARNTRRAPTARHIPAWGGAPCSATPDARGLKAPPIAVSVPQIPLVAFHPVLLQERAKFVLERTLPMMYLLRIDVLDQCLQICRPNRKRSVPSLPCELRALRRFCLEPLRRRSLQVPDQLGEIRAPRHSDRKMYMVRNPSHAIALTPGIANDHGKVRIQLRTDRIIENRPAALRTEDHVHHNERERQWHRRQYRSGLQPSPVTSNTSWGFAPCWYSVAPSALRAGYQLGATDPRQRAESPTYTSMGRSPMYAHPILPRAEGPTYAELGGGVALGAAL
jgi:hypothetical protein